MNALNIAVIGSGIAGLSAAWLLSKRHKVTLIEASRSMGGHSNTVDCAVPEGSVAVDTGFIVFNNETYPNLTALFDYLNAPIANSNMGFAVSLQNGDYEYSGEGVFQLLGHARNIANLAHWLVEASAVGRNGHLRLQDRRSAFLRRRGLRHQHRSNQASGDANRGTHPV